jgi:hypothetical protein
MSVRLVPEMSKDCARGFCEFVPEVSVVCAKGQ